MLQTTNKGAENGSFIFVNRKNRFFKKNPTLKIFFIR